MDFKTIFSPFNLPEFKHFLRLVKIFSVTTWTRKNIFPFWCIGYFSVKNHLFLEKNRVECLVKHSKNGSVEQQGTFKIFLQEEKYSTDKF